MKAVAAVALALSAASAVNADVVLNLGSASLAGGQYVLQSPQLSGTLLAIAVSYDFEPDAAAQLNGSYASDASLVIQSPITVPVQWGGYDLLMGGASTAFVDFWSYDGAASAEPGPYTDIRTDIPVGLFGTGTWSVLFGNGWSDSTAVQYNSVTVTLFGLQTVPSPAAAGVFGLAGLGLAVRRRR